jgi:hypothetical protein
MVNGMAERKWLDSFLLPRKKREDFNDEYYSIAKKVVKDWLTENEYEVQSFSKTYLALRGLDTIQGTCAELFGEKLDDYRTFDWQLRKFAKEKKIELSRDYDYFGIGPDFVVKKNREVKFVQYIINQAEPKKYSNESLFLAKKYGFQTIILKLDVDVKVGNVVLAEI